MKTLYFDIDGTILPLEAEGPKPALAAGALERAVRAAGFTRLVCVGQIVTSIRLLESYQDDVDGLGMVYSLCRGAFADEAWFRGACELVADPDARAAAVDRDGDWWYADDLADVYFARAGLGDVYAEHVGGRIHLADPVDDGAELLAWMARSRV